MLSRAKLMLLFMVSVLVVAVHSFGLTEQVVSFNVYFNISTINFTDPYYALNHLSDGKSYYQMDKMHLSEEYASGLFQYTTKEGDCSVMMVISNEGFNTGIMLRDCSTLEYINYYTPVVEDVGFYIFLDKKSRLLMPIFWASAGVDDIYFATLNDETQKVDLKLAAKDITGPELCNMMDFDVDSNNVLTVLCGDKWFSNTFFVTFDLNEMKFLKTYPKVDLLSSVENGIMINERFYGFLSSISKPENNFFGYYDFQKEEYVKLDFFTPDFLSDINDLYYDENSGYLYVAYQVLQGQSRNYDHQGSMWLILDIVNSKIAYLEPTGQVLDEFIYSFGVINT